MKTSIKKLVLASAFYLVAPSLAHATLFFPTQVEKAQALGSRFLNSSQGYRFKVDINPILVEGARVEIGGTITGMTGAIRFDEKLYRRIEAANDDLLVINQIVSSEERGACGFYREERLHLKVKLIDTSSAQVVEAELVVGQTSDRCHLSLDEISATFRPDPSETCEKLLQERSHPQSSLPVPASLVAETPDERIYFVPRLGSNEPREGLLLSCEFQEGSIRRLAERTRLTCSDIPATLRLKATWLDCR